MVITREYLKNNPNHVFVFDDNLLHKGTAGAAALRDLPNVFGFITKKAPNNADKSFYTPDEYKIVYKKEINKLSCMALNFPKRLYLVSKLGSGLANRYNIWETIIKPNIKKDLGNIKNIQFLW